MDISRRLGNLRHGRRIAIGVAALLIIIALMVYVLAGTVSPVSTTTISADTAATGGTGTWTTLTGPTYSETVNGDLDNGTVILTAPSGFQFNPSAAISVRLTTGDSFNTFKNMNNVAPGSNVASTSTNTVTVTASTITFTIFSKSQGSTLNTIVWQGIQVRPTNGYPLASGNITASGSSGIATVANSTNFGTLTEVAGTMKTLLTVLPGQTFTAGTGVTGTAASQTAGTAFNITSLVAVDKFNNLATTYTGTKTISYTGPSSGCGVAPSYTTSVSFSSGQSTTTLATTLKKVETTTITASDSSLGSGSGTASSSFTVAAAPMSQLVVTLPGQSFSACTGNSGTPTNQTTGVAFKITSITATDAYFNIITSYSGTKTLSYSGPSSGSYTTSVSFSNGQSTTNLNTLLTIAETTTISVSDGAVSGPASSSFTVNGAPASRFNAFETTTATAAISGVLKTKVSGTSFSYDIVALTSGLTPGVSTGFTGAVKVELVDNSSGTSCSTLTALQPAVTETFTATDKGRHTVALITEANAWKNVKVRISYPVSSPTIVSCSTDNFAIRPSTLGNVTITDQLAGVTRTLNNIAVTGGTVHKAGQAFSIQATAQASTGATTAGYSGTPTATISQCSSGTAVCPVAANLGNLSLGTWSSSSGTVTTSTATYSEAGAFAVVLQDQQFAAVDANDSTDTERFITSSSVTVGRFVPDHFAVTAGSVTPRNDIAACSTSLFTYMNEPFGISFKLTAQNASNAVTKNYTGTLATLDVSNPSYLNFGAIDTAAPTPLVVPISGITKGNPGQVTTGLPHKLSTGAKVYISGVNGMTAVNNSAANNTPYSVTVIDATHFTIGVNTSSYSTYTSGGNASRLSVSTSSGTWANGVVDGTATLVLQRAAAPDGAFNATKIGIAPQDPDGVQASAFDLDADNNATAERVQIGLTQFRFGRLAMKNAHGSELLGLPIAISAQYWNGTAFITNADDSCTSIGAAANVLMSNRSGGITVANMASPANVTLSGAVAAGSGKFTLTKPVPTPTIKGGVDLTLDLGVSAENKAYLQGKWTGTNYDQNPTSRATFGVSKGAPIIYQREIH